MISKNAVYTAHNLLIATLFSALITDILQICSPGDHCLKAGRHSSAGNRRAFRAHEALKLIPKPIRKLIPEPIIDIFDNFVPERCHSLRPLRPVIPAIVWCIERDYTGLES